MQNHSTYHGEPCRICGSIIIGESLKNLVFAGASRDARAAHLSCWVAGIPREIWAYPNGTFDKVAKLLEPAFTSMSASASQVTNEFRLLSEALDEVDLTGLITKMEREKIEMMQRGRV